MAIIVSVQYGGGVYPRHDTVDPMLLPLGNPVKCHEEALSLQPMIPPKRFDIFFPLTGGCLEGLDEFRFFFKQYTRQTPTYQPCAPDQLPDTWYENSICLQVQVVCICSHHI